MAEPRAAQPGVAEPVNRAAPGAAERVDGAETGRLVMPGLTTQAGGAASAAPPAPPDSPEPPQGRKKLASVGRASSDGSKVFRMTTPLAGWWIWVAFAVAALADLAVQGRDRASVQAALVVLAITGLVYACAYRPKVIVDDAGITVRNPIRDYRLPWGAVKGVFLAESVEFQCARPAPRRDKTVYCWSLYTRRRSRARAALRAQARQRGAGPAGRPAGYARLPRDVQELASAPTAEIMARELVRLREEAVARGPVPGVITGRWAWPPLAAIFLPAIGLVAAFLVR